MLKYNQIANSINKVVLNYKCLHRFKFFFCFENTLWLCNIWTQLTKSFFFVKYKWFKFFAKTILNKMLFNKNNIYGINLNKFEQKIIKIYLFKAQIITNYFISINNWCFKGIVQKSKKKLLKHWFATKPSNKPNFLLKKFYNLIVKIKKLKQNKICDLLSLKLNKLFLYNVSDWVKSFSCFDTYFIKLLNLVVNYGRLAKKNLLNAHILDCFLVFFDSFMFDLVSISNDTHYIRCWNKCLIGFKNNLSITLAKSFFIYFIRFNLFFNLKKGKMLNRTKKSYNFFNYFFYYNHQTKNISNKTQSLKKYKNRFLVLLKQKKTKLFKSLFFRLQNMPKKVGSSKKLNIYTNMFFNFKSNFKCANRILKTNFFKLEKTPPFFYLNAIAPIKSIFKNLQFFGFLTYQKNKSRINCTFFFYKYYDIIKLYSIVIIKLLFYYQKVDNLNFLKRFCLKLRHNCILILKSKCKSFKNHAQTFQRYYNLLKFKFLSKWRKFMQIKLIKQYNYNFLLNRLILNFNFLYITWTLKNKHYFYNVI